MIEIHEEILTDSKTIDVTRADSIRVVVFGALVGVAGGIGGYLLVDNADQDEAKVTEHNIVVGECIVLPAEAKLTGCAPDIIKNFGDPDYYIDVEKISLESDGSLGVVVSVDEEVLDRSLNNEKISLGFEPENPLYRVGGALGGFALGFFLGGLLYLAPKGFND